MSKEEAKAMAKDMIKDGKSTDEISEKTGLATKTIGGMRAYLAKKEEAIKLLEEGKSVEDAAEEVGIPIPMVKGFAKDKGVTLLKKHGPKPKLKEEKRIIKLYMRANEKEQEMIEKGKKIMLAFQDAEIIPKKLKDASDAEFIRLATLSLANAMIAMQQRIKDGKLIKEISESPGSKSILYDGMHEERA